MNKFVYLDNAATTRIDDRVLKAMLPYMTDEYGNASSQYSLGRRAANALSDARDFIASAVGCSAEEIYFTSGGTESDHWALRGVYAARLGHIVLSAIEHPALLSCADDLKKSGAEVTLVMPDGTGTVSAEAVADAIRGDTVFVGVMSANNETGVIQPAGEIAEACAERGVFFYSDCVQSAGVIPFDVSETGGIGFSAHKFHGPKGTGVLYLKKGTRIARLIAGGRQERGLRGGTSDVAGAVGCAKALEIALAGREENTARIRSLRDRFLEKVLGTVAGTHLNGDGERRLPANANIRFDGCKGDKLLMMLDMRGIAVSTGSACAAGAVAPSHVLTAMGLDEVQARSSVRFTFGKYNTEEDAEIAADALAECVKRIRSGKV